ncbi:15076_t:CDS:1, partial [Racocetra fulgida]
MLPQTEFIESVDKKDYKPQNITVKPVKKPVKKPSFSLTIKINTTTTLNNVKTAFRDNKQFFVSTTINESNADDHIFLIKDFQFSRSISDHNNNNTSLNLDFTSFTSSDDNLTELSDSDPTSYQDEIPNTPCGISSSTSSTFSILNTPVTPNTPLSFNFDGDDKDDDSENDELDDLIATSPKFSSHIKPIKVFHKFTNYKIQKKKRPISSKFSSFPDFNTPKFSSFPDFNTPKFSSFPDFNTPKFFSFPDFNTSNYSRNQTINNNTYTSIMEWFNSYVKNGKIDGYGCNIVKKIFTYLSGYLMQKKNDDVKVLSSKDNDNNYTHNIDMQTTNITKDTQFDADINTAIDKINNSQQPMGINFNEETTIPLSLTPSQESSQESSQVTFKELSQESFQELSQESSQELSQELSQESSQELFQESFQESYQESSQESYQEPSRELPQESYQEQSRELPQESYQEPSQE